MERRTDPHPTGVDHLFADTGAEGRATHDGIGGWGRMPCRHHTAHSTSKTIYGIPLMHPFNFRHNGQSKFRRRQDLDVMPMPQDIHR